MKTIITPKIAKLLKENGFDVEYRAKHQMYGNQILPQLEPYNETRWRLYKDYCLAPTIAEVVMWIYEKYSIWIVVDYYNNAIKDLWFWNIKTTDKEIMDESFNCPTDAYLAAIEYILTTFKQDKQVKQENGIDICVAGNSGTDKKTWVGPVTQTTIKSHIENIKTLTNELIVIDNRFVNSNAEKIQQKLANIDTLLSDCLLIGKG